MRRRSPVWLEIAVQLVDPATSEVWSQRVSRTNARPRICTLWLRIMDRAIGGEPGIVIRTLATQRARTHLWDVLPISKRRCATCIVGPPQWEHPSADFGQADARLEVGTYHGGDLHTEKVVVLYPVVMAEELIQSGRLHRKVPRA